MTTTPSVRRFAATLAVGLALMVSGYLAWVVWGPLLGDTTYLIASVPVGVVIGLGSMLAAKQLTMGGTR